MKRRLTIFALTTLAVVAVISVVLLILGHKIFIRANYRFVEEL